MAEPARARVLTRSPVKKQELRAVVFNPDGTVKRDYGVISVRHKNRLINYLHNVFIKLNRAINDERENIRHGDSSN